MTPAEVVLTSSQLPKSLDERWEWAQSYFGIREFSFEDIGENSVLVRARWPTRAEYYVDPHLEEGLAWWGATVEDIPVAVETRGRFRLSLLDSWTVEGWSKWLAMQGEVPSETVTVLHVDDHDDLMSPIIAVDDGAWFDGVTGDPFNVFSPATVRRAVTSGAIQVGSFFAPLIHALPNLEVRHLCDTRYGGDRANGCRLNPTLGSDPYLPGRAKRPGVEVVHDSAGGARRYRSFTDVNMWCADLAPGPVLLHVDMDFFSNRFDGDSDWSTRTPRHDPSLEAISGRIEEVFAALASKEVAPSRIDVALSPGFFPAEHWAPAVSTLDEMVRQLPTHAE